MEQVLLGIITKPQGLKGQFRVNINYSNFSLLSQIKQVIFNSNTYNIEKIIFRDKFAIFKLNEFNDINEVEKFRGKEIYGIIEKSELQNKSNNSDYINSLVLVDNVEIGYVKEILSYGSADVFIVMGKTEIMFPNARDIIISFDKEKKIIVLDKTKYEEMKC